MPLPWHIKEKRDFIWMRTMLSEIVIDGLRTIFKQEWDARYTAMHGAWNNTAKNGADLYYNEKGRRTKIDLKTYLTKGMNEWDCTTLFDAILYSKSIGKSGLSPIIHAEVDTLRQIRNKLSHCPDDKMTEAEFENDSEAVRKSFRTLGLSTKKIDELKVERKRVASFRNLPPQPSHEVVSRTITVSQIINDLDNLYQTNKGELTYFYVFGNPGSGKSQLARQIAEDHYNKELNKATGLTFVMTLNAENLDNLLQSYTDFAHYTNCPEDLVQTILKSNEATTTKIRRLRSQIATTIDIYEKWLVIADNVENLKLVSPLLPQRNDKWKNGQVLITTQDSTRVPPSNSFTKKLSVSEGLREEESLELLTKVVGKIDNPPEMLMTVAKALDHQPLALAAAAVYVLQLRENKVSPRFSWCDYLEKLEEGKRSLTEETLLDTSTAYSMTMTTAVLLAVEKIAQNNEILKHVFQFLSFASHESLPLQIATHYVLSQDESQHKEQVCLNIRNCSLLLLESENEDEEALSFRLHRVVHNALTVYAKKQCPQESSGQIQATMASFHQFKDRQDGKLLVPHLKSFFHKMKRIKEEEKVIEAWFSDDDDSEKGERLSFACENIDKTSFAEIASSKTCEQFSFFGEVLKHYGEFSLAKEYYCTVLHVMKYLIGQNHPDLAIAYNNLGSVHRDLGDYKLAMTYLENALKITREHLGDDHPDLVASYSNLGLLHQTLGEINVAKTYLENAIDICRKQLEDNHPDLAACYSNLGMVHQDLGELNIAKTYYEMSVKITKEKLGNDHPDLAKIYNNLGFIQNSLGELNLARTYYEKAIKITTEQLGDDHPELAASYGNLGLVLQDLGELSEAKTYFEKAVKTTKDKLGDDHPDQGRNYNNLGSVYQDLGELNLAQEYIEKAIDITKEHIGENHHDLAKSYSNLGLIYQELGELDQAKTYLEKAIKITREQLGDDHSSQAINYSNLGSVHEDSDELNLAKKCHEKALDIELTHLEEDHLDVGTTYDFLGGVHEALRDYVPAKQYYKKAYDIYTEKLGPEHDRVRDCSDDLDRIDKLLEEERGIKEH